MSDPQELTLVLAHAKGIRFDALTIPMIRTSGGSWRADYTPDKNYIPGYSIFFFEDEKERVDNNGSRYWEILNCRNGEPDELAVDAQSSTYEGRLLAPGIQRPPDLTRAVEILKADLKRHPARYSHYFSMWRYQLQLGRASAAVYQQVGSDLDAFIGAHGNESGALRQTVGFVASEQQKLPPSVVQRFRDAIAALPHTAELVQHDQTGRLYPISRNDAPRVERFRAGLKREAADMLAELDYRAIDLERANLRKKAADYFAFAAGHPENSRAGEAYGRAFEYDKAFNEVAGAEAVFEKWAAFDPLNPNPPLAMAEFYVARKTALDHAVKLLDTAAALYLESQAPSSHRHFRLQPGRLEFLRGQAHRMLKDLPAARADLEAAAKAAPGDPDIPWTLGQVCEEMGDNTHALEAYLSAASAPYQESPAPREAYERLFIAQGMGSEQDAGRRLLAEVAARIRRAAAEYTPIAMTRPAPEFAFTDLAGRRFDNRAAQGKPAILTFWAIWCAPCIAELPALEKFQQQHPGANLLAVEIGHQPGEVKAFLAAHNLKTLHVAETADWPREFGAAAIPLAIVMDRFGQIQFITPANLPMWTPFLARICAPYPPTKEKNLVLPLKPGQYRADRRSRVPAKEVWNDQTRGPGAIRRIALRIRGGSGHGKSEGIVHEDRHTGVVERGEARSGLTGDARGRGCAGVFARVRIRTPTMG